MVVGLASQLPLTGLVDPGSVVGDATAARLCREYNDANVLALGERLTEAAVALDCVDVFLHGF